MWCRLRSESVCPLYRRQEKQLTVALVDQEGLPIAQAKLKVQGPDWAEYKAQLVITDKYKGELGKDTRFALLPKGEEKVAVDMVSLMPQDTYKGHGLRKDLAEIIAELKPRFVRFPGGCMLHGQGLGNIYHWKESIGELKDRNRLSISGTITRPVSWGSSSISSGVRIWALSLCQYWLLVYLVRTPSLMRRASADSRAESQWQKCQSMCRMFSTW